MQYAVIRIKGSQYKVSEGDEILVDKVGDKEEVEPEVLLVRDDKSVKIGVPQVKGAKVILKKLGEEKGKKIYVIKYKSKSRYRRKIGSRPQYTRLSIESIA